VYTARSTLKDETAGAASIRILKGRKTRFTDAPSNAAAGGLVPQLGRSPFFVECPVLVKADIESQNFEFPVVNGGLTRNNRHSPKFS